MLLPQAPGSAPVEASFGCHASQEPSSFEGIASFENIAEKVSLSGGCASRIVAERADCRHR
jgi:hypothetical protein